GLGFALPLGCGGRCVGRRRLGFPRLRTGRRRWGRSIAHRRQNSRFGGADQALATRDATNLERSATLYGLGKTWILGLRSAVGALLPEQRMIGTSGRCCSAASITFSPDMSGKPISTMIAESAVLPVTTSSAACPVAASMQSIPTVLRASTITAR